MTRVLSFWVSETSEKSTEFKIRFDFVDTSLSCESSVWQCKEFLDTSLRSVWQENSLVWQKFISMTRQVSMTKSYAILLKDWKRLDDTLKNWKSLEWYSKRLKLRKAKKGSNDTPKGWKKDKKHIAPLKQPQHHWFCNTSYYQKRYSQNNESKKKEYPVRYFFIKHRY